MNADMTQVDALRFTNLIVAAQAFMRRTLNSDSAVSQRDIIRVIRLSQKNASSSYATGKRKHSRAMSYLKFPRVCRRGGGSNFHTLMHDATVSSTTMWKIIWPTEKAPLSISMRTIYLTNMVSPLDATA